MTLTETSPAQGSRYAGVTSDLVRALPSEMSLRDSGQGGGTTMFGHFAVFNRWTEIDSFWEGNFMERLLPAAFKKTFSENRSTIKVLAEHGYDPTIGKRALGQIDVLREDETGAYYEVPLVDAQDVRELILPRLRAGLYGASFRFTVMREEINDEPGVSEHNPKGIQERSIKEVRLFEFGPVTFPAYEDATAGARSLTDDFCPAAIIARDRQALLSRMEDDPAFAAALAVRGKNTDSVVKDDKKGDKGTKKEDSADRSDQHKDSTTPDPKKGTTPSRHVHPKLYGLNAGREAWRL